MPVKEPEESVRRMSYSHTKNNWYLDIKVQLSLQMFYIDLMQHVQSLQMHKLFISMFYFSYQFPSLFIQVIWEWYSGCLQHFLHYITTNVYIQMHPYASFRFETVLLM